MASTPKSGNFLTKKSIGGIPNWVLLAVGAAAIYYYQSKKSASSTSSTSAQSQQLLAQQQAYNAEMAASAYYPAQGSSSQTPVYVIGSGVTGGNSNPGGTPGTPTPSETLQGSGIGYAPNTIAPPITSGQNTYSQIPNTSALSAILKTPGNTVYYQPTSGEFAQVPSWSAIAPGTPLFQQNVG